MSKGPGSASLDHCNGLPLYPERPPSHAHLFQGWSSLVLGHVHLVEFFTYPVNGSATDQHVHTYQGHTSVAVGHFHRFIGRTGCAIPLPDGSHYHDIDAIVDEEPFEFKKGYYVTVSRIKPHTHEFKGFTGTGLGYEPAEG
ncbi:MULTISPECIES: YmaF family protein [Paenibacillus]|uniref:Uncharacterized protein n=1 Tax=Paenibacillus naphthalenovorans TaxID=162209 RepID=A0A0U2M2X4_9BACL|nr:YmaF family protein [Paenibacillus naphthalenovorans]ALS21728.1 hypothetical protein IJ22_13520 [Paenibacillus naphthalenovorans]GCL71456.1 hypothetical protein PN4B1_13610 [Paenibacillus naphthalenovorans]SDI89934.1 YmaF family protein [Paenibacillus naphthalenovorans]